MLQELIIGVLDAFSSQTTKKDLIASTLLYLFISGIFFYYFHEIILNWLNIFLLFSPVLLFCAIILFNLGIKTFYDELFLAACFLKNVDKNKLKSLLIEYLEALADEESASKAFNKFIYELTAKEKKIKDISEAKMKIICYLMAYLIFYFLSLISFFFAIWTISYESLVVGNSSIFEMKNGNFLTLLYIILFLIFLTLHQIKSEGIGLLFGNLGKDSETNKITSLMTNIWLDSLLWYFTYTYDRKKRELRRRIAGRTLKSKIFGGLYKMFFALTPPEFVSGIKAIPHYIVVPLIENVDPSNRLEDIKKRLSTKFYLVEVIVGKESTENNILRVSWSKFIEALKENNSPISLYFLFPRNESKDKNKIDAVGILLSFMHNPYFYHIRYERPYQMTQRIEEKALIIYILLITIAKKSEEYERFLVTVF